MSNAYQERINTRRERSKTKFDALVAPMWKSNFHITWYKHACDDADWNDKVDIVCECAEGGIQLWSVKGRKKDYSDKIFIRHHISTTQDMDVQYEYARLLQMCSADYPERPQYIMTYFHNGEQLLGYNVARMDDVVKSINDGEWGLMNETIYGEIVWWAVVDCDQLAKNYTVWTYQKRN